MLMNQVDEALRTMQDISTTLRALGGSEESLANKLNEIKEALQSTVVSKPSTTVIHLDNSGAWSNYWNNYWNAYWRSQYVNYLTQKGAYRI